MEQRNAMAPIVANAIERHKGRPPSGGTQPVQYLPGVGPQRASLLAKLGIHSVADLLTHYPRGWEDRRQITPIAALQAGTRATLQGRVEVVDVLPVGARLGVLKAAVRDATGVLFVSWFKHTTPRYDVFATLRRQIKPGEVLMIRGEVLASGLVKELRVEEYDALRSETVPPAHWHRIVPVYPLSEGIDQRWLRGLILAALDRWSIPGPERLPAHLREALDLPGIVWAIHQIHFPDSWEHKERARRRLAFEEFFLVQVLVGIVRKNHQSQSKPHQYTTGGPLLPSFQQRLGFTLTASQTRAIEEIVRDLRRSTPMHRLLQGDVGSGKTVVAAAAMLLAVENGLQTALMAPTEILAFQHYQTLQRLLMGLPVRIALVRSAMPPPQRRAAALAVADGQMQIVIGTHALLEGGVRFQRLGLVVIDEQHRFGVNQRLILQRKALRPDVLVMTATPIPRTLALTAYGDLDVSLLAEQPPGRPPILTQRVSEGKAHHIVREAVQQGRQAFIVYPVIEASERGTLRAATQEAERLCQDVFHGLRVGLLHGRMKEAVKQTLMEDFRAGRLDILIATTVVEVGVDIPQASVMVVHHAERFGLATLHQLRGRVGRWRGGAGAPATEPARCLLVGDPHTPEAERRLAIMVETTDGFRISEADLALRGPGEVIGLAQHGLPELKIGDLIHDVKLIMLARQQASELVERDPHLRHAELVPLREALRDRFTARWRLAHVG